MLLSQMVPPILGHGVWMSGSVGSAAGWSPIDYYAALSETGWLFCHCSITS